MPQNAPDKPQHETQQRIMKEYTHTMAIEELQKLIDKGIAKPDEVERWTADPPILPSWKVVELELSDVPEFIQGGGVIRFNGLELESPFDNYTSPTGERIDFSIPSEVAQEISRQITAQHKADYFAKVEQEFTKLKNGLLTKLQDSPDPERGRQNVIERWERILEGRDTDGLQRTEINLRTAWADITEGIRYIGGQKHRDRRKAMQMAAPPDLANYRNLVWHERQVDNGLRGIYTDAEAAHRFLQWLKDTPAEQPQPVQPITNPRLLAVVSDNGFQEYHNETHKYFEQWQPILPASTSHEYRFELDTEAYKKTYFDTPHLHDATFEEGVLLRRLIKNLKPAKHPAHVSYRDYLKGLLKATGSPEQVAKPNTPAQGSKGGTGAEIEVKLTQRQAAYLLAYQNARIRDPRSDGDKLAEKKAKELCKEYSTSTGEQLYRKFDKLRSAKQRQQAFNTELAKYKEGNLDTRAIRAILKDVETIIPRLEGEQKTEAQNDLKRWNTAFQSEVN